MSSTHGSLRRSWRPGYCRETTSVSGEKCGAGGWKKLADPPACGKQTSRVVLVADGRYRRIHAVVTSSLVLNLVADPFRLLPCPPTSARH